MRQCWSVRRRKAGAVFVRNDVGLASPQSDLIRHNTATGFVVHGDATLLHWHGRVQAWLPPGGHVEANEDPVQAVLREVREETGLEVEVVPALRPGEQFETVRQIEPPRTILIEDVADEEVGAHQHIDMIYFTRVESSGAVGEEHPPVPDGWCWVTAAELRDGVALRNASGEDFAPPDDVRTLGLRAIGVAGESSGRKVLEG